MYEVQGSISALAVTQTNNNHIYIDEWSGASEIPEPTPHNLPF